MSFLQQIGCEKRRYSDPWEKFFSSVVRSVDGPLVNGIRCLEWTAANDSYGYGCLRINNKTERATRWAYRAFKGEFDPVLDVCHACDNPPCVEPAHLFLGTAAQNLGDMKRKGREAHGSRLPQSKLTEKTVRELISLRGIHSQRDLARRFNVSPATVDRLFSGVSWKRATEGLLHANSSG